MSCADDRRGDGRGHRRQDAAAGDDAFDRIVRAQGSRYRVSCALRSALWRMVHSASWTIGWVSVGCLFGIPSSAIEYDRSLSEP